MFNGIYYCPLGFRPPCNCIPLYMRLVILMFWPRASILSIENSFPIFEDKLVQLSVTTSLEICSLPCIINLTQRFILAKDQAYFKAVFFSGDRPGDMGLVKVPEILRFPNDYGYLFNHVWGKTLRDGDNNVFGIKRNPGKQRSVPLYGSGSATKDRFNEGLSFSPTYSSRGHTRCTIQLNCSLCQAPR